MIKVKIVISIFLWMVISLTVPAFASVKASGEFTADKACQAYQSLRKKTNPDGAKLDVGSSYDILELNVPKGTTWYRLRVTDTEPEERWVYFECGKAKVSDQGGHSTNSGGRKSSKCQTAGEADSYVFAASWQPAFCEGHSTKPECSVTDPNVYQAKNFTLHGLWPNKQSCGTGYGFCGTTKKNFRNFCDYPKVPMNSSTFDQLEIVMPSAAAGSCLQRHEWYKHGTCQTEWIADGYFDRAMRLLKDFNDGVAPFIDGNIGKSVSAESFFNEIDNAFGEDAHQRMQISCYDNQLVDVYMHLPANLPEDASLKTLIQQSTQKYSKPNKNCGASFKIDAIGQE